MEMKARPQSPATCTIFNVLLLQRVAVGGSLHSPPFSKYLLDLFIDEQSPDEDERQAMRFLAQPAAKGAHRGKLQLPSAQADTNNCSQC